MRKSSAVKSPAVARRLIVLAFLAAGCGLGQAPHMAVGSECSQGDVTLQLEAGITTACASYITAVVDVIQDGTLYVAHEVRHVQLGGGHSGWCVVYAPWSKAVVGWDQDDYLGCH